jgi:hypothetical protein
MTRLVGRHVPQTYGPLPQRHKAIGGDSQLPV